MSALIPEALVFASTPSPIGTGEAALLSVLFGALVGLSLGLTGGGGSIFAVPLLVYGLVIHRAVAWAGPACNGSSPRP